MTGLRFLGTGAALPDKVLTNADLEKIVDTTDQWITERTGIKERRMAADGEATSDLAAGAARRALEDAGIAPAEVDLIVVATCTPDHLFPSVACLVQKSLGIKEAISFDVSAACSGFLYGLACVRGLLETGAAKTALLIGADALTKFTDWKDRGTCVLFGDGAGAMVIRAEEGPSRLLSVYLGADGERSEILTIPGGGSRHPLGSNGGAAAHPPYIYMDGKEVFKHAVTRMIDASLKALRACGKTSRDLALVIPHQANLRIIDAIAKRLDVPDEKVFRNVHKYGNMSAATTVIALDEARRAGLVKSGDLVQLIAFGAGLTWGAAVLQW
ncbi:MAG: beta-ketoacyl-ACP synthase III [Elusimicrobiota bacterium]